MAIDKNTVMKEAQKFAAKGQFDKAIAEWKKIIKESPNDAAIHNTIGDLCLKKEAKADAVEAYKKAADILAADGFTSKAIALYKKIINIDPQKIEVHLALGDLNAEKGLTGNALESYKVVADHYSKHKETVKALGIYQKMADLNASNAAFRIKLGDMYAKEHMTAEASKAYLQAADVHVAKDAFKEARQLFEKVLALEPDNKAVYHKAGIVYLKEGKFSEACKALKPAFESDPANKELADAYLDALFKADKAADAEQIIRKIIATDLSRLDLRERLSGIYLSRREFDKALDQVAIIADAKAEQGDVAAAENSIKAFVAEHPGFTPAYRKLAEFYMASGRDQQAAKVFLQAAEVLIDSGDREGAKTSLVKALELSPELEEARECLNNLNAMSPPPAPAEERGGGQAPPPRAPGPSPLQEPQPALSILEENPAINEAFTEVDVLVKYGLAAKALEQLESLVLKYPDSPQLRMRLQDLYRDQKNAAKAVEHALALADLYTGKGMNDQAVSVLRSALAIDKKNPALLSRLGIAPEPAAPPVEAPQELSFEAPEEVVPLPIETPPFAHAPAPTDEIVFEGLDGGMPHLEPETPAAELPQAVEWTPPEPEQEPVAEQAPITPAKSAPTAKSQPAPGPAFQEFREDTPPRESPSFEERPLPAEVREKAARGSLEPGPGIEEPAADVQTDIGDIWAEAEFYFQQGLFNEAKKHYAKIIELNPGEKRAINRLGEISREEEETQEFAKLAEAVEGLEGAVSPGTTGHEMPENASDEEAVRRLMAEISQLNTLSQAPPIPLPQEPEIAPPPKQKPASRKKTEPPVAAPPIFTRPAGAGQHSAEEDFLDLGEELQKDNKRDVVQRPEQKTDDFFDLAAELRDELSGVSMSARPAAHAEEQSLDEIFEEFKRGVEEQSVKEDVDTHYNLGVAYKEMGLLDDAVSEFIMTPEDEPKFYQSRYMLGLCYMEKGEYHNATIEIQNALSTMENLGIDDDEIGISMHYDLGLAYQGIGNTTSAISEFQIVHTLDPQYRDAALKMKELQKGDFISLDQLKDDIEREISSKFLEEGERIQKEEQHRKNERVRN